MRTGFSALLDEYRSMLKVTEVEEGLDLIGGDAAPVVGDLDNNVTRLGPSSDAHNTGGFDRFAGVLQQHQEGLVKLGRPALDLGNLSKVNVQFHEVGQEQ